jgi:regulator of RNase E activity RraA
VSGLLPTAALIDAATKLGLDGDVALLPELRPYGGAVAFAGEALTADCAEGSTAAMLTALKRARRGAVLVVRGTGPFAYLGDLAAAEAARRHLAGVVVIGLARDRHRLAELDLPVFALGLTPRGAAPGVAGRVGVPIMVAGGTISSRDLVVGDEDGVLAIAADARSAVVERAREIVETEDRAWERVRSGRSLFTQASQYGAPLGSVAATAGER